MLPSQYLNIGQEDKAEKVKYLVTENCIFFIGNKNLKLNLSKWPYTSEETSLKSMY